MVIMKDIRVRQGSEKVKEGDSETGLESETRGQ